MLEVILYPDGYQESIHLLGAKVYLDSVLCGEITMRILGKTAFMKCDYSEPVTKITVRNNNPDQEYGLLQLVEVEVWGIDPKGMCIMFIY